MAEASRGADEGVTEDPINLVLDLDALRWSGLLVRGPKSPLSPFTRGDGELTPPQIARLQQLGVLDESSAMSPRTQRWVHTLAVCRSATEIQLRSAVGAFDACVYVAPEGEGDRPVALLRNDGGIGVRAPAPVADFLEVLGQAMGRSALACMDFKAELSALQALVLASMLDHQRQVVLGALAQEQEVDAPSMTSRAIRTRLFGGNRVGWLIKALGDMTLTDTSEEAVEAALSSLALAGHVENHGDGRYRLQEPAQLLARRLLLPDTELRVVKVSEGADGTTTRTAFTCLQSGVHDVLLVQTGSEVVRMETSTAAAAVDYVRFLFEENGPEREPVAVAETTVSP